MIIENHMRFALPINYKDDTGEVKTQLSPGKNEYNAYDFNNIVGTDVFKAYQKEKWASIFIEKDKKDDSNKNSNQTSSKKK